MSASTVFIIVFYIHHVSLSLCLSNMAHKRRATSSATVNSRRYPVISSLSRERDREIVVARGCVTDNKYLVDIAIVSTAELDARWHYPFARN